MSGELESDWLPGSFTKNFSWGAGEGLKRLHENINVGFDGELKPVPRSLYRERVSRLNVPELIPINFFLFNKIIDNESYLIVDELVFSAITARHSSDFDALALFVFNYSRVGHWKGAERAQSTPALWALHYVADRISNILDWKTDRISADDIEKFLRESPKFHIKSSYRKVATNLNYMYRAGNIGQFSSKSIERFWVDSFFAAADRISGLALLNSPNSSLAQAPISPTSVIKTRFLDLTGPQSLAKTLALSHLTALYNICGGLDRFNPDLVRERTLVEIPEYVWQEPNDPRPPGAVHPTNPRILKSIPRACADLARLAGFEIVIPDEVADFDFEKYSKQRTEYAVNRIRERNITPNLTAEELHKMTRGE